VELQVILIVINILVQTSIVHCVSEKNTWLHVLQ